MILHLVRHGQTAHNRDGLGLGRSDEPLTEVGVAQADAAAATLAGEPVAMVYSSPLQRAAIVARLIAEKTGAPLEIRDDLIEMDVGDTEGMNFPDMRERYPEFFETWRSEQAHEVQMPGGESMRDVARRVGAFAAELRSRGQDETVVVASHNFVQRALMCELLGIDLARFRSFAIDLASITSLSIRGEDVRIGRLNDVCHLHSLEPSGKQP